MQTSALTEDWPATEAPAVTTSPAFPVSIPTDKTPTDEPKTFSPTVTPTIPHWANYEYELELVADDFRQPL